ncbi:hypothetical protein NFI95_15185 [Acetobacteraceae bacterium KSS8]|uniref:Uncharacterized protein n=1 Tax=Endosaccharibacter trunci TaxID=2812733 RepID=A0ABT1WAM5_9PROT|nr:hypothetical protein [Acetobacteraceae bacterium KSS8]
MIMHHHISAIGTVLVGLVLAASAQAQTVAPTPKPMGMQQKMRVCAQMRDDMARHRPMTTEGMKLMAECQRMDKEMSAAPAPAATLDR